jgi:pimeloyl-ACP methyl ester carboxylesterase
MPTNTTSPTVVLVHGAWADGSSWTKVINALSHAGVNVTAAPIPLTSLPDDVAAVDRAIDRVGGPVVLVGHAYAGAVIAACAHTDVAALVYIAALPRTRTRPSPMSSTAAPRIPWRHNWSRTAPVTSGYPTARSQPPSPSLRPPMSRPCWPLCNDRFPCSASGSACPGHGGKTCRPGTCSPSRIG